MAVAEVENEFYPCLWNGPGRVRGLALVLNYEFNDGQSTRHGSQKDVHEITKVLTNVGYHVCLHESLSYDDTESVLEHFMQDPWHGEDSTDSTVVVVMSHGMSGNEWTGSLFQTEDKRIMASQPIIDRFQTILSLVGKPKIFLFNFCRGNLGELNGVKNQDEKTQMYFENECSFWMNPDEVRRASRADNTGRPYNDTLIVYSTVPRFVSIRSEKAGSFFIQEICNVLRDPQKFLQKDLVSMLMDVDARLQKLDIMLQKISNFRCKGQTMETLNRGFNKKFYLTPFHLVRNYYLDTLCRVPTMPWCPKYTWSIDEVYTELTLIQGNECVTFSLDELFQRTRVRFKNSAYRILIEGDAGYGKTTLTLKLAWDWCNKHSNTQASYMNPVRLLYVVKLADIGTEFNLQSHIESIYDGKTMMPFKDALARNTSGHIMIVLDGYDEASDCTKGDVVKIMKSEKWSGAHVVLTSRYGHVPGSVQGKTLLVAAKGFSWNQVELAVSKILIKSGHIRKEDLTSDPTKLVGFENVQDLYPPLPNSKRLTLVQFRNFTNEVLYTRPYNELVKCPLICAMLCCLVGEYQERQLPETLSDLYFAMINRNLFRSATKKAESAAQDTESTVDPVPEWDWDYLKSRFLDDHKDYLKEFGKLCLEGLKTNVMCFTLFQLSGKLQSAQPNHPKVTQLVDAGVLVKDSGESYHMNNKRNAHMTYYRVPHRTTAEFLAAYYLSQVQQAENKENIMLELFWRETSFEELSQFLFEMDSKKVVVDTFKDIKFPPECLENWPFLETYFRQHVCSNLNEFKLMFSEFETFLPHRLKFTDVSVVKGKLLQLPPCIQHIQIVENVRLDSKSIAVLLELVNKFGEVTVGRKVELRPSGGEYINRSLNLSRCSIPQLALLVKSMTSSGFHLGSLSCANISDVVNKTTPAKQAMKDLTRNLKTLFDSKKCPAHLELTPAEHIPNMTKVFERPARHCPLKRFDYKLNNAGPGNSAESEEENKGLIEALSKTWASKLEYLGLTNKSMCKYDTIKPLIGKLSSSASLTSLHLKINCIIRHSEFSDLVLGILGSKLQTLSLEDIGFNIEPVFLINSLEDPDGANCRLKSLILENVTLTLNGGILKDLPPWNNATFTLDELRLDTCVISSNFVDWLSSAMRQLRVLTLGKIRKTHKNKFESYECQLLKALTLSSGRTLQELTLLPKFWQDDTAIMLHPIRESLQQCSVLKTVILGYSSKADPSQVSIGFKPSVPLTEVQRQSFEDPDPYSALFNVVLNVPNLQTLGLPNYGTKNGPYSRKGCFDAVVKRAMKWPGTGAGTQITLTLLNCETKVAAFAECLFRACKLKYVIKYKADRVYELWFPPLDGSTAY